MASRQKCSVVGFPSFLPRPHFASFVLTLNHIFFHSLSSPSLLSASKYHGRADVADDAVTDSQHNWRGIGLKGAERGHDGRANPRS